MKSRRLRTLSFAIAGGLLALTASTVAPTAAAAAEVAYNTKQQFLTRYPIDSDPTSCVDRRIFLAEGKYTWAQVMADGVGVLRWEFSLGEGWYTWSDCLDPQGSYPTGWYKHTTTLDPDNPNWQTVSASGGWQLRLSLTTTWGSYLDPLFSSTATKEEPSVTSTNSSVQVERLPG